MHFMHFIHNFDGEICFCAYAYAAAILAALPAGCKAQVGAMMRDVSVFITLDSRSYTSDAFLLLSL
jgi:hypothetical protein